MFLLQKSAPLQHCRTYLWSSFLEFWHSNGRPRGMRCSLPRHWYLILIPLSACELSWTEVRHTPSVVQVDEGHSNLSLHLHVMPATLGAEQITRTRLIHMDSHILSPDLQIQQNPTLSSQPPRGTHLKSLLDEVGLNES